MLLINNLLLYALIFLLPLVLAKEDYYKILGIDPSASDRDIRRAYKTLSKKWHPDKNPNNESAQARFLEIGHAYEALSDDTLRQIYDQHGHDGLENHKRGGGQGAGFHDPFDLFRNFFGGGGGGGAPGQRRGPDMEVKMALPLRDFYNGKETDFTVEKNQICDTCKGSGSEDGQVDTCDKCGGRGMIIQKHQLAPGIFQQVQMHCDKCGGQGRKIKHVCKVCAGAKLQRKPVTLTAFIEKGMGKGTRLVFENEADESPDWVAGDMILNLVEDDPKPGENDGERTDGTFFRRKGRDLYWKEVLSLREAWMGGWTRNLTHLDGHVVQLSRQTRRSCATIHDGNCARRGHANLS